MHPGHHCEAETATKSWINFEVKAKFHPSLKDFSQQRSSGWPWRFISLLQVLKGGQEAPTKPKGRPKKNSIPTSEEIEAEEKMNSQVQSQELERCQAPEEPKVTQEKPEVSSETEKSPEHIPEPSSEETTPLS